MKPQRFLSKIAYVGLPFLLICTVSQAGDINKGRPLYGSNCAVCHGQTGQSVMVGAPNFNRGESLLRPASTLLASIRSGKNACPAFRGILADRDILDVIAFVRTLH